MSEQLEEVLAEQQLAAAEGEEHCAGRRQLIEHVLHFGRRHLAVIVVVEITVNAALVAALCQIEVHGEGDAIRHRAIADAVHQGSRHSYTCSATVTTPAAASERTNSSTSRRATSGSTSYS